MSKPVRLTFHVRDFGMYKRRWLLYPHVLQRSRPLRAVRSR